MTGAAELILFGIQAGIRLAQQGQRIYVEATIERDLILPLLNFDPNPSIGTADGYFHGTGHTYLKENPVLKELYNISIKQTRDLTDQEKQRYLAFYLDYKRVTDITSGEVKGEEIGLTRDALLSIVSVRQWANQKSPFPSPLQRVMGTLIAIGIDYFADIPGAADEQSATGRALKGFLKSIDDIDFAQEKIDVLVKGLFIASIETIGANPALLNADKRTERLVEAVASGLIADAKERIEKLTGQDLKLREDVLEWAQLVLRSVLGNAGEVVYASPDFYLGIDDPAHQRLVSSVGKSVLDVIIDSDDVDLTRIISREGLDTITKAALKTVSDNPDLLGIDHKGLKNILSQITIALADSSKALGAAIIPEVMGLVLEKTAGNVEILWPEKFRNDPAKHLLIIASKELLNQLSKTLESGAWQPKLSKQQMIEILNVVLDEVVQNPAWLSKPAGVEISILASTINAALATARNIPPDRISSQALQNLLEATIKAVAMRRDLIDQIPLFGKQKKAIEGTLELIFDTIMPTSVGPDVRWTLGRTEVLNEIVSSVLSRISVTGVSEGLLLKVRKVLHEAVQDIATSRQLSMESLITAINNISVI